MFGTILGISALLIGVFAMQLGFSLQATALGVRAGVEGFPLTITGAIMAMYYVGYIGGTSFTPRFVHTVGHIRVFAALASMASTTALLHALFVLPVTWIVLRLMTGFCVAGLVVVAESWLNNASSNHDRGSILSVYMVVTLVASAMGQLLLNAAPIEGFALFIVMSVLVSISLVPMALSTQAVPQLNPVPPMPIKRVFQISPAGWMSCFSTGLINGSFWGMGAVYALGIGLDARGISIFMACAVTGGIITQWPLGRLSDKLDRRIVLMGLAFAVAATSVGMIVGMGLPEWALFGLAALYGSVAFPLYAISIAHVNDQIQVEEFVPASSALLMIYAFGAIAGPFLAGAAMEFLGPAGLFYYTVVVALAMGGYAIHRLSIGTIIDADDKEDFVNIPKTSGYAYEMAGQVMEEAAEEAAKEDRAPHADGTEDAEPASDDADIAPIETVAQDDYPQDAEDRPIDADDTPAHDGGEGGPERER